MADPTAGSTHTYVWIPVRSNVSSHERVVHTAGIDVTAAGPAARFARLRLLSLSDRAARPLAALAQAAFPLSVALLYGRLQVETVVFAVVPIGFAAWVFGVRAGLVAIGLQATILTILLNSVGAPGWDVLLRGGQGPTIVLLLITAMSVGYLRDLRNDLRQRAREAEALADAAGILAAGAAARGTLDAIVAAALRVVPSDVASLVLVGEKEGTLRVAALAGGDPRYLGRTYPATSGVTGRAFRTKQIQRVGDLGSDPDYVLWTPRMRSALAVPAKHGDRVPGVLYFEDAAPGRYTERDVRLMRAFADHVAIALGAQQRTEAVERLALYDTLTDLPNRTFFAQRLEDALDVAGRQRRSVAVLLLDLDRFTDVNEAFGHRAGDLVLRIVGARIRSAVPAGAVVARFTGDEFAIASEGGVGEALGLADTMRRALEAPLVIDGHAIDVSGTMGVAVFPEHGESETTLLQRAYVAMHAAKTTGRAATVYAPALDAHSPDTLELASDLRRAITAGELALAFQPIVSMRPGVPHGAEALARWPHPTRGIVSPAEFIPIAERSGAIGPLTDWVLDRALRQSAAWTARGVAADVSVNLSMRNLFDPELPDTIARRLAGHGVPACRLWLEITESVARPTRSTRRVCSSGCGPSG